MRIRSYEQDDFGAVDQLWQEAFPDDPDRNHAVNAIPAKRAMKDELLIIAEDRVVPS